MKNYRIKIYFHSGESELFGYSNDSVVCLVSEEVKDEVVSAIADDNSVMKILSIDMQDGGMRYINMRTVLYIDVKEVKDEKENK